MTTTAAAQWREQIDIARRILDHHREAAGGMCTCTRPQPCSVARTWAAYDAHWRARIDALTGPAMLLPTLAAQAPRRPASE